MAMRNIIRLGVCVLWMLLTLPTPAFATDLYYSLMSPNFGGSNGIALQMAQQEKSLRTSHAAAMAAAAKAAAIGSASGAVGGANSAFINSIISQLNGLIAYKIASTIANAPPGHAGTIQSDGATITYVNQDGQLSVTLTTPTGSTTLSVPTGG
jgi:Type VIII secretion system (T8SS), CsgF protein